jgi:3-oxoacyl-[acyl-carrier protein] reductase
MPIRPMAEVNTDEWDAMIDVNLKGTLYAAAAALPHLIASGAGDFVSLASVAGLRAFPGEAVYNASKFGQLGFTRALDHELREHGVRATNVCPGGVRTEFAIGAGREHGDPQLEGMMTAEDVAEVVRFAVTRPRHLRLLTTSLRPLSEPSWG